MNVEPEILSGKICPYCFNDTKYVDSSLVYGKSYGMIYLCQPCNAWVGVHKGTDKALGRLANAELREWKKHAHAVFDLIWDSGSLTRPDAYKWLSEALGIVKTYTHIGMFDVEECKKTVMACNEKLKSLAI